MANTLLTTFQQYLNQPLPEAFPPFTKWLNGTIIAAEEGTIEMYFTVRKEMTNPLGLLHGGVQAAILDDIIGITVATFDKPSPSVSINISVDFLGKAYEGDTIFAKSIVIRQGRQVIHMAGELRNQEQKLIAKATSNMLNVTLK
ncbi:MAG: PaaI family thioesterase [Thermonemataceae bacterium]